MQHRLIPLALSAAVALLCSNVAAATEKTKAAPSQATASQAKASAPTAPIKAVDINSASRTELKTLPGIGNAEADRIIAARPYPSKAKLVSAKVLSVEAYDALKGRIVAIQPPAPKAKTDAKTAAKP